MLPARCEAVKLSGSATRASRGAVASAGWVVGLVLAVACVSPSSRSESDSLPPEPLAAGFAALGRRDYGEAAARFAEVSRRYPVLDDYALFFGARAAAQADRDADALADAQVLRDRHPDSVWVGPAMLLAGELLRTAGNPAEARGWLAAARDILPAGTPRWARATVGLAEIEYEAGESAAALDLARAARQGAPRHLSARRARRLTDRIRSAQAQLLPEDRVEEAEMRLREGDAVGARDEATTALAAAPSPPLTARALWTRAQAEHALGLATAEASCLALGRDVPDDPLAARALLAAAGWRWNANDDRAALELFRDLTRRFAGSPQAPDALYGIGRILQEQGGADVARYADAFTVYTQLADAYPHATLAPEARWRAGWVRYLAGDFALAERAFRAVGTHPRTVRQAAEYWRGRALAHLGRDGEAEERFTHITERHPTSYYAGLAAEQLGRVEPPLEPPAPAPPPPFPADLTGAHAERAKLLARLTMPNFARLEVEALRRAGAPPEQVGEAYRALGAPGPALRVARELAPAGAVRQDLYPLGYWDTVLAAAHTNGIDPMLVAALIRQESLFDPEAVSPANARGLMQLVPATARDLARDAGKAAPGPAALHDPATNIQLGVALLARLRDRYQGSLAKALAAYNAGEDAVAKWEGRYAGREADEFVELISYRETRDYVKVVLHNYRVYRRLYGRAPSASETSAGSPPKAPLDITAMTSPGRADATR
jgi:soluble lytic murein transglycosylase